MACHRAIGDHADDIGLEELWNLVLVFLNLVEGGVDVCLFVSRVFQINHGQRQAVDEGHEVGMNPLAALARELVDDEPVITRCVGLVEYRDVDLPTVAVDFHVYRNAVAQPDVEIAVGFDLRLPSELLHTLLGVAYGCRG